VVAGGVAEKILNERAITYEPFEEIRDILRLFEPDLLIVGTSENPDSPGLGLVREAGACSIPTVGAVDAFPNAGFRFRGRTDDPLHFAPDWLMVPDVWTCEAFEILGYAKDRIHICGHPQYDYVLELRENFEIEGRDSYRDRHFGKVPTERSIVLFVAEQPGGLNPGQFELSDDYTLRGNGGSFTRNDIVLDEFLTAVEPFKDELYLVLRIPPKAGERDFEGFLGLFNRVSKKEPALEVVFGSDYVFGMTSMLMIEAALLGRPTFSILPRAEEREWLPTIRGGLTESAVTRDELIRKLPVFFKNTSALSDKSIRNHIPVGARSRISSFVKTRLGNPTTQRQTDH
jgi:hypothetical protein